MSDTVGINVNNNPYNLNVNPNRHDYAYILSDGLRTTDVGNVFDRKRDEVQREIDKGNDYLKNNKDLSDGDKQKLQKEINDLNSVIRQIDKAEADFETKNEKAIRNAEAEIKKEAEKALKDGKITDGEFKKLEKAIDKQTGAGSEISNLRKQASYLQDKIGYNRISDEFKPKGQSRTGGGGGYTYTPAQQTKPNEIRVNSYKGAAGSIQNGINVIDGYQKDVELTNGTLYVKRNN